MYRLFERAQLLLSNSDSGTPNTKKKKVAYQTHRPTFSTINQNVAEIQQRPQQQPPSPHQYGGISLLPTPEDDPLMSDQAASFWMNGSPCFSTVDQLLSPGFSLSEDVFQNFFTTYDTSAMGVNDQLMNVPNDIPIELSYHT
jgi:hypothetical protein